MIVSWHGNYTLKVGTKQWSILIDPSHPATGIRGTKGKADIVALTNPADESSSYLADVTGDPLIINTPGEYSFEDMTLYANSWHDDSGNEHNIQRWHIEGITMLHVGAIKETLSELQLQELEKLRIDILIVPVGGGTSLNSKQAINLITKIEPRVVIPVHYKIPKLKEDLESADTFLKDSGASEVSAQSKYKITTNKLPAEGPEFVRLNP